MADDISDKKQESSDVEAEIDAGKAKVKELENEKDSIFNEIEGLKEETNTLDSEIYSLNTEIENSTQKIEKLEVQVEELEKAIGKNKDIVKERMRTLYKNQGQSYMQALFEADGFTDFLKRLENITTILKFDKDVLEEFEQNQSELGKLTAEAKGEKAKLEDDKLVLEVKTIELNAKTEAKNALVAKVESDIAAEESRIAQREEEFQELVSAINEMESKQMEINQMESNQVESNQVESDQRPSRGEGEVPSSSQGNGEIFSITGNMAYPITSTFVPRENPITGKWESHGALDIGAPHGSGVFALKAGTVAYAGWMSGYGNVVVINHGDMSTLYGHNSELNVSPGDQVSGGQRIASVGSTGNSTGPHIHFEVIVGGVKIDPAPYYIY